MHEEAARLQNEASALADRLQAVLHDKFRPLHNNFDAETPIDKALNFLSQVILVRPAPARLWACDAASYAKLFHGTSGCLLCMILAQIGRLAGGNALVQSHIL